MISVPYDKDFQTLMIDDDFEMLEADIHKMKRGFSEDDLVLNAMAEPIGSQKLSELAKGKNTAAIIISDHTRPVPSKRIIPHMLKELREGNSNIVVTLLVATGFHRGTTKQELVSKLGQDVIDRETIIVHDCSDEKSNVKIGTLPSGAELVIDRIAAETDLLIAEGFIEPHFFAGFSGGRKSILPGVCSRITVLGNHCSKFIASEFAKTGNLANNPIHADMVAAARIAKLRYIVNVIIDEGKKVAAAFAGDPVEAHEVGCMLLKKYCRVSPEEKGDIVITSNGGYPLDQNMYQAVKGLTAAEAAAKKDAILIICAKCGDGTGGEDFYRAVRDCESPEKLIEGIMEIPMERTKPDQWEYQILARILMKHKVIFVSDPSVSCIIEDMKMQYAGSLQEAYETAKAQKPNGHTVIIKDGVSVIVE